MLPGKSEANPKEFCNAITLRSGTELPTRSNPPINEKDRLEDEVDENPSRRPIIKSSTPSDDLKSPVSESPDVSKGKDAVPKKDVGFVPPPYVPKVPYPQRFKRQLLEKSYERFKKLMDTVQVTMPFADVIRECPIYNKLLKDLLTKKRTLDEKMVVISHECSAIIQHNLPKKMSDPGSFTLPCSLGPLLFPKSLVDLGASISLMPLSISKKLGLTDYKRTRMTLLLADNSIRYPVGILEDLPVRVGDSIVPTDFVVLEMDVEPSDPLILGRPFLATAGAIIDVRNGLIDLNLGDIKMRFNIVESMRKPTIEGKVFYIQALDEMVDEYLEELNTEDALQITLAIEPAKQFFVQNEAMGYASLLDSHKEEKEEDVFQVLEKEDGLIETSNGKTSIDGDWNELRAPKVELKTLPKGLRYEFLGSNSTYPVIVNDALSKNETCLLLIELRKYRRAIGYGLDDIHGLSPSLCMHRIYLDDDSKSSIEHQRRLNPNLKEVVKKEILKLLEAGIIYPISDSTWISPVHVVPKKGGITVVRNEEDELIAKRTITGHRMCVDYRKLNALTRKDHFPLPFIDQMLERLANHEYYCFLDGYSGFFQIPIHPLDQEKTTFTCPYGTFAYRRMPFGLCNAPATFQRCMMSIFSDLIEDIMEVFMDDFSVYGSSFTSCLFNLCRALKRCEETNLVLNWEKCHFMVTEGIVLGHRISGSGIEVDRAKIEVMVKLQPPKTVKDIRSFLGHAGFYRRFIKDFSSIARPLTRLLCKEVEFKFDGACMDSF